MIQSVAADAYRMSFSAELPSPSGTGTEKLNVTRRVLLEDQRNARTMRNYYNDGDAETFPKTTPFFSGAIVTDLRQRGSAAVSQIVARRMFGMDVGDETFTGTLARIEAQPVPVSVIVNGKSTDLPTIHVRGTLASATDRKGVEINILDDPDNPIPLRWKDDTGRSSRAVKIDFPTEGPSDVERALADRKTAVVYGIYFSFNSATIRPESDRVLKEIADVMTKNADWKLRVEGHTDSIGSGPANLELSKRRAAAVKDALVTRFKIAADRLTTGGSGAAVPKSTNDTADGRALNRRVELARQ
jgi:outer membrane protein OmpA-like peptidoglycan-associated protein